MKVKSNKRQRADDHHQKNRRTPGNVKGVRADTKDLKNQDRDVTKSDNPYTYYSTKDQKVLKYLDSFDSRGNFTGKKEDIPLDEGTGIYPYNGWEYEQEMDHYPDVSKIFHYATKDGKQVDIDWSPYVDMEEEDFKLWVDLGMPDRKAVNGIAPLNVDDLLKLAQDNPNVTHSLLVRERMQHLAGIQEADDDGKEKKGSKKKKKGEVTDEIDMTKLDAKTRMALKKANIEFGAQTKGDPLAALVSMVTSKIKTLSKDDYEQDKKIANNRLQDKYQDQQIGQMDDILKHKKSPEQEIAKDKQQDKEIATLKAQIEKLINR